MKFSTQYYVPLAACATPTEMVLKLALRMFALCPGDAIQPAVTPAGVEKPAAMFSPAVDVPPQPVRTVIMLLCVRLPTDARWSAQDDETLHDLYARGFSPAATRCAFVAAATDAARS